MKDAETKASQAKKSNGGNSLFQKLSGFLSSTDDLPKLYAIGVCLVVIIGLCCVPFLIYEDEQLYPKTLNPASSLDPYDRGGVPLTEPAEIVAQYPENSKSIGYVTAYLTVPRGLHRASWNNHRLAPGRDSR
jgi:energy-converting hydrogenase A subunit F